MRVWWLQVTWNDSEEIVSRDEAVNRSAELAEESTEQESCSRRQDRFRVASGFHRNTRRLNYLHR